MVSPLVPFETTKKGGTRHPQQKDAIFRAVLRSRAKSFTHTFSGLHGTTLNPTQEKSKPKGMACDSFLGAPALALTRV